MEVGNIANYNFIEKLRNLNFVKKIILFGSRARGDNLKRADIDLAVVCPKASTNDWFRLLKIIDEADTLLKVDCIRFDELADDSVLRQNIENDGRVIYAKNTD